MKPSNTKEIQELDLIVRGLLVASQLDQRLPVAFECSLVQKAKRRFLLGDFARGQDLIDCLVEVTADNIDRSR